jgi:hypothetical protein
MAIVSSAQVFVFFGSVMAEVVWEMGFGDLGLAQVERFLRGFGQLLGVSGQLSVGWARGFGFGRLVLYLVDCDLGRKAGRNSWWGGRDSWRFLGGGGWG